MSKQTPYYKHYQQLLDGIKSLYPKHFNGKVPSTLNKLSNITIWKVIYDNNLTNKDVKRLIKKMIKMIQSLKNNSITVSNIKNKKFIND